MSTIVNSEPTNHDILDAVNNFATKVEQRFDGLEGRFDGLEKRVGKIEATMVTKEYFDDKLANLKGDIIVTMRKEDTKLRELVTVPHEKNVLNDKDVKRITSMEPFPQIM